MTKIKATPGPSPTSEQVRQRLVEGLELDLIGPGSDHPLALEVLPQVPSRWYLAGFLVPTGSTTPEFDEDENQDLVGSSTGVEPDDLTPERTPSEAKMFPSSTGMSVIVSPTTQFLGAEVFWADYQPLSPDAPAESPTIPGQPLAPELAPELARDLAHGGNPRHTHWQRVPFQSQFEAIDLGGKAKKNLPIPGSRGLKLVVLVRKIQKGKMDGALERGSQVVSIFVVNEREIHTDSERDQTFAFQVKLKLSCKEGFVPRPNLRGDGSNEMDERVADLQYRDTFEFATGHGISSEAHVGLNGKCHEVETRWIPRAEVERVDASQIEGIELRMEELGRLAGPVEAKAALAGLVVQYREWIEKQKTTAGHLGATRGKTVEELALAASRIANRIEEGIAQLAEEKILEAFRLANQAMALAARQRIARIQKIAPKDVAAPTWRPFQLAFLLMNLRGMADPNHPDREVVDLLFFPTGGGKTEAYLGLAAFTLVLRRFNHQDFDYAGVSVLMRYTLRLLTLDQLGRASLLIMALESLRWINPKLGEWRFEIGLWVGMGATPNVMGQKGDSNQDTARARTIKFNNGTRSSAPIPVEECPWCGTKLEKKHGVSPFILHPNPDNPTDLIIHCYNPQCAFCGKDLGLPIIAVDEPIYRRLPCFVIATVDKFAAMPWTGKVGALFGKVDRVSKEGFFGPTDPPGNQQMLSQGLPPPALIVQDELHLISGPMGTLVGLYETALENLCYREVKGKTVRPKIVASTATVRRATEQIRALFDRREVDIFPSPGPNRRDSFFAKTSPASQKPARMYVGITAQGVSPKKVLLRTYLALLSLGQKCFEECQGAKNPKNPADPYMTLVGYFNSLRELGSTRRLIEDEVISMISEYSKRKRVGEKEGIFANRKLLGEVSELTSRVDTAQISETKQRLTKEFREKERVDVVVATNMISVGLDISRLGLMVVTGQPKSTTEYIQATSRVGREEAKPGLVVTIFSVHKHRDRSHYERFHYYHETFYRTVEATSVTPFSPRALDRGLAGAVLGLARLGHAPMTKALGAMAILTERSALHFVAEAFGRRAEAQSVPGFRSKEEMGHWLRGRVDHLLDEWTKIVQDNQNQNTRTQYQKEEGTGAQLVYDFLSPELIQKGPKYPFKAQRSMRDVEPSVDIWARAFDDQSPKEND